MLCPYCNSKFFISDKTRKDAVIHNTYLLVSSECCNQPLRITAEVKISAEKVVASKPKIKFHIGQEITLKASDGSLKKDVICTLDYEFKNGVHHYGLGIQTLWTWYSMKEDGRLTDNMFGVYEIIL